MSAPDYPPNPSTEELQGKGRQLRDEVDAFFESIRWSKWRPLRQYGWSTIKDRLQPDKMRRFRSIGRSVVLPTMFEVRNPYIIHDSDSGLVTVDIYLEETQIAPTLGLRHRADPVRATTGVVIKDRYPRSGLQPPERTPKPLTEESRGYGLTEGNLNWSPRVLETIIELSFDEKGELGQIGSGYGATWPDGFANIKSQRPIGEITGGDMYLLGSFESLLLTGFGMGAQG